MAACVEGGCAVRNKSSLLLMEQLVMVLVFALAAALCLGIFVKADRISRETASRDEAVLIAQNAAELLKATAGDAERTLAVLTPMAGAYRLEIEKTDSEIKLLGNAEIRVYLEETLLFILRTGWQEDAE